MGEDIDSDVGGSGGCAKLADGEVTSAAQTGTVCFQKRDLVKFSCLSFEFYTFLSF